MAWRDELKPASFRGKPFHVEGGSVTGGRRQAAHEYPQRDAGWQEDMGRRTRVYKVDAFLLGAGYMTQRDALMAALEAPGPGKLVHPYHGEQRVVVETFEMEERTERGGYVQISITFTEAGEQLEPSATTDLLAQVQEKQAAAESAAAQGFADKWRVLGQTGSVVGAALDKVNKLMALPAMSVENWAWVRSNPVSALGALLPERLQQSMGNPFALARGLQTLMRRSERVGDLLKGTAADWGGGSTRSAPSLSQAGIAQSNSSALETFVAQSAAINVMALAVGAPREDAQGNIPTSSSAWTINSMDEQSAAVARAAVLAQTDALLFGDGTASAEVGGLVINAPETEIAQSLMDLRTSVIDRLAELARGGGVVRSSTPLQTVPAVVLAHALYGDDWFQSGRAEELAARNRIIHPGFVPAGQVITYIVN
ncbi:hypothetical protein AZ34_11840 [Hylemonella gracilis str. Niagara R]|uniref:DNA circulation N-terminal domain-containing protein n=1 Tax=Hylemonella gracilis str. Niagara R TaxID=1458275 RepID=A0A016XIH4_9BURK|nr:DNA circularization N-terminal domain-containing protein [Hylemonella gracilis]EYC51700.1 hypothetical protein AZ34_11840 [Hylemonella gracilis str. Niagara R]